MSSVLFTGSECRRCGSCERYVRNRDCAHCAVVRAGQWRKANLSRARELERLSRARHHDEARERQRRYRREHPELHRAGVKRYQAAHPDKVRIWNRNARVKYLSIRDNLEKARAASRISNHRRYHENVELARAKRREQSLAHPDRGRDQSARRRALKTAGQATLIGPAELALLRDLQGGLCAYCIDPLPTGRRCHLDHVVPLSRGGRHEFENVVLSCQNCNQTKFTQTWIPALGHLSPEASHF